MNIGLWKTEVAICLSLYEDYILSNMNSKLQADTIYTGFSTAFDKINYRIIFNKLVEVGLSESLLHWFWSYL